MAGSKKDAFETDILKLIFTNTTLAGIGDATGLVGSTAPGNFYIALFKDGSEPSDSAPGTECDYTGYARKAVARSGVGWTVASGAATNAAAITFDPCTAGSNTAGAFGICKAGTKDVNDLIYWGELTTPLAISVGITPEFAAGELDVTED